MGSHITAIKPGTSSRNSLLQGDWQERLTGIVEAMREMSLQTDPLEMVQAYGSRVRAWMPADRWLSLSRRGLESPEYRITRSSTWTETIDPWKEKERLPLYSGGLLADLIYGDEPRLIEDITALVSADDPASAVSERHALADGRSALRSGRSAEHGGAHARRGWLVRSGAIPRVGLGEQPVRPGDA